MYSAILAFLPASLDLLYHAYLPASSGPSIVSTVVGYDRLAEGSSIGGEWVMAERVTIDMSGRCWAGEKSVHCCSGLVGKGVSTIIPLLASYQIFYGLLVFSLGLAATFQLMASRKSFEVERLKEFRTFALGVMVLKDFASVCGAVFTGCALLIVPLIEDSIPADNIVDVRVGWGFVVTVSMAILSCFFTLAFENNSRKMLTDGEQSIRLGDEDVAYDEDPEKQPLLVEDVE
ncbi:hypothetical protein L202_04550 [Cryptococcus amylolentus CBS 6039]|uniref:Autophagy-related protein n=2 Tax=Cryptococcus amylolentus TaxID=104669 RepID=A0A1E3HTN4_9TREE|nr:hypothetical protein L202_04550 [Cryptococcus amylolentus CBS 6039]ODN79046.1 hypothetical protein L202_04550 [Cryptococcus amylolentus CBS 6039]ODO06519.1 hypothetical protein I350_03873 [Cryptococcus amylolentus CBS 6273]